MIELNKTYITKFATKERFTVTKIGTKGLVWGVYENNPNLGECPLQAERLIINGKDTTKEE